MPEPEYVFSMTDHVCATCLARVLERRPADGPPVFRCSNCGAEGEAHQGLIHPPICACGARVGNRDAGIRCVSNSSPRPELPGEIVAMEFR